MNIPATVFAAVDHLQIPVAAAKMFSGRLGEAHVIVLIGAVAAAIGLACVVYGLRSEWQQWTQSRIYHWRKRD